MYLFEAIEQLGYPDLAFELNGKTKEEAAELCKIHGISNAHYILDHWDEYKHIRPPKLKTVFHIAGMTHLYDEFVKTVKTQREAYDFIKKHNLKPHQAENIRLHWSKVLTESQQSQQ